MKISAQVCNTASTHETRVSTSSATQALSLPAKPGGGSAVNGGELLMLALATCYCNDLYREAARLQIQLEQVEVEAWADFEGRGLAATRVQYRARLRSPAPAERIAQLLRETDAVAEVHNTLRSGAPVELQPW
jgi:organic hydroperoxide reductase OsmC/OhrA